MSSLYTRKRVCQLPHRKFREINSANPECEASEQAEGAGIANATSVELAIPHWGGNSDEVLRAMAAITTIPLGGELNRVFLRVADCHQSTDVAITIAHRIVLELNHVADCRLHCLILCLCSVCPKYTIHIGITQADNHLFSKIVEYNRVPITS